MNAYNFLLFAITFLFIISCKESKQVETKNLPALPSGRQAAGRDGVDEVRV